MTGTPTAVPRTASPCPSTRRVHRRLAAAPRAVCSIWRGRRRASRRALLPFIRWMGDPRVARWPRWQAV